MRKKVEGEKRSRMNQQLQRFWTVEDTAITESIPENAEKSPFNRVSSEFRSLSQA